MAIIKVNPVRASVAGTQQKGALATSGLDKDLARILTGLKIANQGFGLAVDFQKFQQLREQREQATDLQPSLLERSQSLADIESSKAEALEFREDGEGIPLETRRFKAEVEEKERPPSKPSSFTAKELRNEWRKDPVTKTSIAAVKNHTQINDLILRKNSPTGINDLAILTKYNKMLDELSVVRESEIATVIRSQGLLDQVKTFFRQLDKGVKLSPPQRAEIKDTVDVLLNAQRGQQERFDESTTARTQRSGIDVRDVIDPIFEQLRREEVGIEGAQAGVIPPPQPDQQGVIRGGPAPDRRAQEPLQSLNQRFGNDLIQSAMKQWGVSRAEAIQELEARRLKQSQGAAQ